jgi:hypothetical protein
MKAKLIKRYNGDFYLIDENNKITSHHHLSKQNCDEIFGVVDVEKLAMGYDLYEKINFVGQTRAYIAGFNKAMELNKDKLFTLEDMMNCWNKALKFQEHKQTFGEYIQSLQQPTEIEVEIEMECCGNYSPPCNINCEYGCQHLPFGGKPKLDSEECLILKRK